MVEIISGEKGKGKTKYLLDKVNTDIKKVDGSIVYIDKNTKHMYELDSKIRLINMGDYPIDSTDEFLSTSFNLTLALEVNIPSILTPSLNFFISYPVIIPLIFAT